MIVVLDAITAFNTASSIEVQAAANAATLDNVETPFGPSTLWILRTGVWDDEGIWDDEAFWKD